MSNVAIRDFIYKLYDGQGNYIKTLAPDELISDFGVTNQIDGGQGVLRVQLKRPFDDYNTDGIANYNNILRVYEINPDRPKTNLVRNGDFSEGDGAAIGITGWLGGDEAGGWVVTVSGGAASGTVVEQVPAAGASGRCLHVKIKSNGRYIEAKNNTYGSYYSRLQQAMKPNTQYRLTGRYKIENATGDATNGLMVAVLMADTTGAGQQAAYGVSVAKTDTDGWVEIDTTFTTDSDIAFGHAECRVYGHNGTGTLQGDFYFDNIRLEEVTQPVQERLVYTGYLVSQDPQLDSDEEFVELTFLGAVSKLSNDLWRSGTDSVIDDYATTLTDPAEIVRACIDNYKASVTNSLVDYKNNKCLALDGSTAYADAGSDASINITKSFTAAGWVRFDTKTPATTDSGIIGKYAGGGAGSRSWLVTYRVSGTQYGIAVYLIDKDNTLYDEVLTTWVPATGSWHHIAVAFDASAQTLRIYTDGILRLEATSGLPDNLYGASGVPVTFGTYSGSNFFEGALSQWRLWARALSVNEVLDDYQGTPSQTALVGRWEFDSLVAGVTPDETDNANDATVTGGVLEDDNPTATTISDVGETIRLTMTDLLHVEAVERIREFLPHNYYTYVDASGLVNVKQRSSAADHTFTIGKNILAISTHKTIEGLENFVLLWNGKASDDAEYLRKLYYDNGSIDTYETHAIKPETDARITHEGTLDAKGNRIIELGKDPSVRTTVEVAANYDIYSIQPGDIVQVRNLNPNNSTYSDVMQVVRVKFDEDKALVDLAHMAADRGKLFGKTVTERVRDIEEGLNNITAEQIVDGTIDSSLIGDASILGWGSTLTFSATDYNTVAWTSGAIVLSDGTAFAIDAGNTGNMAARTYIYLDTTASLTVLQTTTTHTDAVGIGKILIATAEDNADTAKSAEYQAFGGRGGFGPIITADMILSNAITANEIAANTITATEMNVSTLSAITANLGSITAGTITGVNVYADTGGFGSTYSEVTVGNDGLEVNSGGSIDVLLGGDINLYDDASNPSEIRFIDTSAPTTYWSMYKGTSGSQAGLNFIAHGAAEQSTFGVGLLDGTTGDVRPGWINMEVGLAGALFSTGIRFSAYDDAYSGSTLTAELKWDSDVGFWNLRPSLGIGVDDSISGYLHLWGNASGAEGGEMRLYMSAAYDTTYDHFRFDVYQDYLRIGRNGTTDMYIYADGETWLRNLTVQGNADVTAELGRAKVGYNGSEADVMCVAHFDHMDSSSFALFQNASGATVLNANTGQHLYLRVGDSSTDLRYSGTAFYPGKNGAINLGSTSLRWNDIYTNYGVVYGHLRADTDKGADIGQYGTAFNDVIADDFINVSHSWFDEGVTIKGKDGKLRRVSDLDAITNLRPSKKINQKTGRPYIDKTSFPIEMQRFPKEDNIKALKKAGRNPKLMGTSVTATQSWLLGMVKEAGQRIRQLEAQVAELVAGQNVLPNGKVK